MRKCEICGRMFAPPPRQLYYSRCDDCKRFDCRRCYSEGAETAKKWWICIESEKVFKNMKEIAEYCHYSHSVVQRKLKENGEIDGRHFVRYYKWYAKKIGVSEEELCKWR